jgi:hypothetical protein
MTPATMKDGGVMGRLNLVYLSRLALTMKPTSSVVQKNQILTSTTTITEYMGIPPVLATIRLPQVNLEDAPVGLVERSNFTTKPSLDRQSYLLCKAF